MSTDLEKYLKEHRDSLDVDTPDDPVIWAGIGKDLQLTDKARERRTRLIRIRNIAAVLIVLVSVGYMVQDLLGERSLSQKVSLADIDRDLGAREQEYRTLVSYKQQEAGSLKCVDHAIITELLEEIQKLDTIYEETLKDLSELGYNEQVIQTIFDTYEKKIYLLELIILENNKIKNHEREEKLFL